MEGCYKTIKQRLEYACFIKQSYRKELLHTVIKLMTQAFSQSEDSLISVNVNACSPFIALIYETENKYLVRIMEQEKEKKFT